MPVHPPAILIHKYVVVAGPNGEEFDAIPKNTRQNKGRAYITLCAHNLK